MKTIFISSTFKDMHYERDLMHEKVLPELNAYAAQYGDSLSFCDLRWGVNTGDLESEEGAKKVLSVCLHEIDRCRPYMVVILGERYGWIPGEQLMQETLRQREDFRLDDLEKSVTALEIEYGALREKNQLENTRFYFREFDGFMPGQYRREDIRHEKKLRSLKKRIRELAGDNVRVYHVHWDEAHQCPVGQEKFAQFVIEDLKTLLRKDWKAYGKLTSLQKDQMAQWDYAAQKEQQFCAREYLADRYIRQMEAGSHLLAITGSAGSGKSTLLAHMAIRLRREGWCVLPVFCVYTEQTGSGMALLRYMTEFLEAQVKTSWDRESEDAEDDLSYWEKRLAYAADIFERTIPSRLVFLLDALDQLPEDEIRDQLKFLPRNLSGHIWVVISCQDRFPLTAGIQKEALPALKEKEQRAVIRGIAAAAGRELEACVTEKILQKAASDQPLYLSLMLQRLLMMNQEDFEQIALEGDGMEAISRHQMRIVEQSSDHLTKLCVEILQAASRRMGGAFVRESVFYLAAARRGLRERDLEGIFAREGISWNQLDFTRFVNYMRKFFLLREDGRWDFAHKSIREGFLQECRDLAARHIHILKYFKTLDESDPVRQREIVYHVQKADDRAFMVEYLSGMKCGTQKSRLAAGMLHDLAMTDQGDWLCELLSQGMQLGIDRSVSMFLIYDLNHTFSGSRQEHLVLERVQRAHQKYAAQRVRTQASVSNRHILALTMERLAAACMRAGDQKHISEARNLYERVLSIDQSRYEAEPSLQTMRNLSLDYRHLGCVYEAFEDVDSVKRALAFYRKSIHLREKLAEKDPSGRHKADLAAGYYSLASALEDLKSQREQIEALNLYEKSYDIHRKLVCEEPSVLWRELLAQDLSAIGRICLACGERKHVERAMASLQEAVDLYEALAREQRTQTQRSSLANAYSLFAKACLICGGDTMQQKALDFYEKCYGMRKELDAELKTARSHRNLSVICSRLAQLHMELGGEAHRRQARVYMEQDMEISEELAKELGTPESFEDLAIVYLQFIGLLQGEHEQTSLQKAIELCKKSRGSSKKIV